MNSIQVAIGKVDLVSLLREAAQSTLGIIALLVIALSLMAFAFFQKEAANVKVGIFAALLVGSGLLVGAVVNVPHEISPQTRASADSGAQKSADSTAGKPADARNAPPTPHLPPVPSPESAYALIEARDWPAAIRAWTQRVEANPGDYFNYFHRATAYRESGNLERAIADLDKVLSISNGHATALNNRGRIKIELQRIEEACADFERAAALGNQTAVNNRARYCS